MRGRPLPAVAALLLLLLLLAVGDRVAAGLAEDRIAAVLRRDAGLAGTPDVAVAGFPFLTQAVAGRYERVDVSAAGVPLEGGLRAERLRAELTGVRVPLADVLGGVPQVAVDGARVEVLLAWDELEARLDDEVAGDVSLSAADGAADTVRVEAGVEVLGRELTVRADSRVTLADGRLLLAAQDLELLDPDAPGSVLERLGGGDLDFAVDVGALPFGLVLREVRVEAAGLVAVADGRELLLASPGGDG